MKRHRCGQGVWVIHFWAGEYKDPPLILRDYIRGEELTTCPTCGEELRHEDLLDQGEWEAYLGPIQPVLF